jgi:hypothetical protein
MDVTFASTTGGGRLYCPEALSGEELPMTLQIGLVGREGIVLASDLCVGNVAGVRQTSQRSKLVQAGNHIFAFAGDDSAELIAHMLSDDLTAKPYVAPSDLVLPIFNSLNPKPQRAAIIGIARGQLWQLNFGLEMIVQRGGPVLDKALSGDSANAAVFFSERYYADLRDNIEGLKRLAAHVICTGAKLNPAGIAGLEMVVWDRKTDVISPVSDPEIQRLCDWSDRLDARLGKSFS